jgi:hypothetical protein
MALCLRVKTSPAHEVRCPSWSVGEHGLRKRQAECTHEAAAGARQASRSGSEMAGHWTVIERLGDRRARCLRSSCCLTVLFWAALLSCGAGQCSALWSVSPCQATSIHCELLPSGRYHHSQRRGEAGGFSPCDTGAELYWQSYLS